MEEFKDDDNNPSYYVVSYTKHQLNLLRLEEQRQGLLVITRIISGYPSINKTYKIKKASDWSYWSLVLSTFTEKKLFISKFVFFI